jgi:DNA-binding NtrC family response regulator
VALPHRIHGGLDSDGLAARPSVLLAEDDPTVRHYLQRGLDRLGLTVSAAENGEQAQALLGERTFDVVVTDLAMPLADGFAVLHASLRRQPRAPVIMLSAAGSMSECVRAMRAGAFDFVSKPADLAVLQATLRSALESRHVRHGRAGETLIGESAATRALTEMIDRVADSKATVLITGETGSGKEVVARALHQASGRAGGPLVTVNCGAIPEGLIETELFGHVAGAFTGATATRAGRVREADGGTLFLDEIGDLPLLMQGRLLRVLQERLVSPVGSGTTFPVDVRFVAATNRDLSAMVRAGEFREDLYFRLNVVPVELPPLRSRAEDIPLLAAHFLGRMRRGQEQLEITERALTMLRLYRWPGNVRELEHAIERMVILDRDGIIDIDDLPARLRTEVTGQVIEGLSSFAGHDEPIELGKAVAEFERALIESALRKTCGNRSQAARLLGIGRTTLLDKLRRQR